MSKYYWEVNLGISHHRKVAAPHRGEGKVTGQTKYAADLPFEDLLVG